MNRYKHLSMMKKFSWSLSTPYKVSLRWIVPSGSNFVQLFSSQHTLILFKSWRLCLIALIEIWLQRWSPLAIPKDQYTFIIKFPPVSQAKFGRERQIWGILPLWRASILGVVHVMRMHQRYLSSFHGAGPLWRDCFRYREICLETRGGPTFIWANLRISQWE